MKFMGPVIGLLRLGQKVGGGGIDLKSYEYSDITNGVRLLKFTTDV